ncbi:MAG: polyprenyl synthetase family protein [Candidatus Adiutrix sp.]
MTSILKKLIPLTENINQVMVNLIATDEDIVSPIESYILSGGGKRLRPLIFCLFFEALKHPPAQEQLETAAAFEFLHMASLLHDDIVDQAETRRGSVAAHLKFSVPEAILTGDYLLSKAAGLGSKTDNIECVRIMTQVVEALSLGELLQLAAKSKINLSEDEYFCIIYRKTAALIEGAACAAALLAGGTIEQVESAKQYGRKVGLAFQIIDDILDFKSTSQTLGKPTGHDLTLGHITLPFIRARDNLSGALKTRLCEITSSLSLHHDNREEILFLLEKGEGLSQARLTAEALIREATLALGDFPPSTAVTMLEELAVYAAHRQY